MARSGPLLPRRLAVAALLAAALALGARAQDLADALAGGVPEGEPVPETLALTLHEAVDRGLAHNLALLLSRQGVRAAHGASLEARADLLPLLEGVVSDERKKTNLAAFGFSLPDVPTLVGPFDVFDARLRLRQPLLDAAAWASARSASAREAAEGASLADVRDLVVLFCGDLYLKALAAASRIEAAEAAEATARSLWELARDRHVAGAAPAIDAVRAEVELEARRQRVISARSELAKAKLALARAIGLPVGQRFDLVDPMPFAPEPPPTRESCLATAYAKRSDWRAQEERVRAAEGARRAIQAERLPSLSLHADYGAIGPDPGSAKATYAVSAEISIPIVHPGHVRGRLEQAEARLAAERALRDDLRARVAYDIDVALLDLQTAAERVSVADHAEALAREVLTQAHDRFAAGVTDTVEVVQAQESLALAADDAIESRYDHTVARASLGRALGIAHDAFMNPEVTP